MIDNIKTAMGILTGAMQFSALSSSEPKGLVSPAEAHMFFAIREAIRLMGQEVGV